MTDDSLAGKVSLITGAGSGLGEATARTLATAGSAVVCVDLSAERVSRVEHELIDEGTQVLACTGDISDPDTVTTIVDAAMERFGRLDVVVNSAAIDHTMAVSDMTPEQWDEVLAVNLRGPFLTAKAAFPIMQRQGSGHIVNIASTAATRAWANAAAYHASKWGLIGFSRGLGVEGRPYGIRVTAVIPGGMRTHFFDRFVDQGIPLPDESNLQDPTNVARVILFAVTMPKDSVMQEILVTPLTETSWP